MELILLKDVEHVGRKGDVIRVKDGFARNFLLPQNLALPSTRANQQFVTEQKVRNEKRREKEKNEALQKAESMKQLKISVEARAGEQGKLFGSVTSEDISQVLKAQGHPIEKKRIHLKEAIRSLGTYSVSVELYHDVKTNISVEVIQKA